MEIFAHRGNSCAAPENTLAAFQSALEVGADGIELDVHLTRDGEPVVIHDEQLARTTTGSGEVKDRTLAQLKGLDAGGWFGAAFKGQAIPTLAEVLSLVAPADCRINVELKTNVHPYPGLVPAVLACIRSAGLTGRVVLSSFNHATLAEAMALAPGFEYAALLEKPPPRPWEIAVREGFRALHPPEQACTPDLVAACHRAGLAVRPYTVDSRRTAERLFAAGVDGLFTNFPARLLAWWAEWLAGHR